MERRLRSALAARAGQITADRLRFEAPPTAARHTRSFAFLLPSRRWLPAVAGAAIAIVALGFALRSSTPAPQPIQPAAPSPATSPSAVPSLMVTPPARPQASSSPTSSPRPAGIPSKPAAGSAVVSPRTVAPSAGTKSTSLPAATPVS
ncbi:hypothetical protein SAMN04489716_4941 [Actinoplanes derwentensis]|uniref:Uncharacterized protein n=2 Tax=Actinoplanes derwentensis TaxID=113562 RepID=A0A1H2BVX8_9ACTN|nr:hypothetical protein SAMN04489716_4941 [Actinoplanes derwentensis]